MLLIDYVALLYSSVHNACLDSPAPPDFWMKTLRTDPFWRPLRLLPFVGLSFVRFINGSGSRRESRVSWDHQVHATPKSINTVKVDGRARHTYPIEEDRLDLRFDGSIV